MGAEGEQLDVSPDSGIQNDTPAIEADLSGAEGLLDDAGEHLESETQDELDEIEHEGAKYKIPKQLKDAFLRQADYTQKTQQVAEQRRAIEADREQFANIQKAQNQYLQEIAGVTAIDQRLQEFQQVNWQELMDKDPVQAMKLDRAMRDLQAQKQNLVGQIQQKRNQALNEQQTTFAKRVQEGEAMLARDIKGWSPELKGKLATYGKSLGFSDTEIAQIADPRSVKLLHRAFMYDQLVQKQQKKPEPVEAEVVTKVGASSGAVKKSPSQMTDKEFAAWRKTQIRARH